MDMSWFECLSTDRNGVEAIGFQFGDIGCTNAVGLDAVDVYDESLLVVRWASLRYGQSWCTSSSLNSSLPTEPGILIGWNDYGEMNDGRERCEGKVEVSSSRLKSRVQTTNTKAVSRSYSESTEKE